MPDYNEPNQGTDDYHIPLNENFSSIGLDVEERGPDSDKANVSPVVGRKYYATDTGKVYIGDGNSWVYKGTIFTDSEVANMASGTTPEQGEFAFDGTDIRAGSGGQTFNLSNIGGSGTSSSVLSDTGSTRLGGDEYQLPSLQNDQLFGKFLAAIQSDVPRYGGVNGMPVVDPYPMVSSKNDWSTEIYCSPSSQGGSDTGAGTQADPVSLLGAFRLLPMFQMGRIRIDLTTVPSLPANYGSSIGSLQFPAFYGLTSIAERVWDGDTTNPSNVVIDVANGTNMMGHGKDEHHLFRGMTFPSVQSTGTANLFRDCDINPAGRDGSDASILAKHGVFRVIQCTVGDSNNPSPIYSTGNARIHFEGTDILSSDGTLVDRAPGSYITSGPGVSLNGTNWENMSDSEWATALSTADSAVTVVDAGGDTYRTGFTNEVYSVNQTQL